MWKVVIVPALSLTSVDDLLDFVHAAAVRKFRLVLALVEVLNEEANCFRIVFRQVDLTLLGFLTIRISFVDPPLSRIGHNTLPTAKRSARLKKPDRLHTTALWTL